MGSCPPNYNIGWAANVFCPPKKFSQHISSRPNYTPVIPALVDSISDCIGADSTGATGNFAPVLTQEPGQTLRFAPVPFMAVLLFFK